MFNKDDIINQNQFLINNNLNEYVNEIELFYKKKKISSNMKLLFKRDDINYNEEINYSIKELESLLKIIQKMICDVKIISNNILSISEKDKELDGFLIIEVLNKSILIYCQNILFLLLKKINGDSIENSKFLDRLVYLKILIINLGNSYSKFEPKILISLKNNKSNNKNNNMMEEGISLKPNLNLLEKNDLDESIESDHDLEKEKERKEKINKKISKNVNLYGNFNEEEEENKLSRKEKRDSERNKKRLMKTKIIKDLYNEHYEKPESKNLKQNLYGYYDEKNDQMERLHNNNFKTVKKTKKIKKIEKARLAKIKNSERLDDFSEMNKIGMLLNLKK